MYDELLDKLMVSNHMFYDILIKGCRVQMHFQCKIAENVNE